MNRNTRTLIVVGVALVATLIASFLGTTLGLCAAARP